MKTSSERTPIGELWNSIQSWLFPVQGRRVAPQTTAPATGHGVCNRSVDFEASIVRDTRTAPASTIFTYGLAPDSHASAVAFKRTVSGAAWERAGQMAAARTAIIGSTNRRRVVSSPFKVALTVSGCLARRSRLIRPPDRALLRSRIDPASPT